jgi:hypothetical protein
MDPRFQAGEETQGRLVGLAQGPDREHRVRTCGYAGAFGLAAGAIDDGLEFSGGLGAWIGGWGHGGKIQLP